MPHSARVPVLYSQGHSEVPGVELLWRSTVLAHSHSPEPDKADDRMQPILKLASEYNLERMIRPLSVSFELLRVEVHVAQIA